ncbi:MAG: TPM domain-containing protein [Minisyncoccia bacterium]
MRKILITILLLPNLISAFVVPEIPTGFVMDLAKILSVEQVVELETKLSNFEKSTTNEIAVVTIQSLDGDIIENVAQEIFTKWGIGKKDKNNGVLFLISLTDRQTRIHTGYGVEGDLTDLGTSYIQQDVVTPAFRSGDYFGGINGAVDKMIQALGGTNIVPENYSQNTTSFPKNIPWDFIFLIFIVLFQIIVSILARSKSWWGGGILGGLFGLAIWHFLIYSIFWAVSLIGFLVFGGLLLDFLVSRSYSQAKSSGVNPWWMSRGGGGSGGFGGGGFGGFGGGFSGGGGSSGRW